MRGRCSLLPALLAVLLGGCATSCDPGGYPARFFRTLDAVRLERLLVAAEQCGQHCSLQPILDQLGYQGHMKPRFRKRADSAELRLAYCFDYGIELRFEQLGSPDARLVLHYSDVPPKPEDEVLWSRVGPAQPPQAVP